LDELGAEVNEPGVVVHTGDDLSFGAVDQADTADDVHLPELHRPVPFPSLVVLPLAASRRRGDEPVADQDPVDGAQRRHRTRTAATAELVMQPALTPPRGV
jgi:hypothetical protein